MSVEERCVLQYESIARLNADFQGGGVCLSSYCPFVNAKLYCGLKASVLTASI